MSQDLVSQALAALRQKNYAQARGLIFEYAKFNSLELPHYLIKGLAELSLQDWGASQLTFAEAVKKFPHQPRLWINLGMAQENLGHIEEAVEAFEQAMDLSHNFADAYGNLSNLYRKQGRFKKAEDMAHRAYELGAPKAQALNSLALAMSGQGHYQAAARVFEQARQQDAHNPFIIANLANLYVDQLNFETAWPLYAEARALEDHSVIRRDEGMARLLAGDFIQGWPLYEARLDLPGALRTHPSFPRWKGEPLANKKILLVAEQGFGDVLQFCRYGRFLSEQGAELLWLVRTPLKRLLQDNLSGIVLAEDDPIPMADFWLPILSLPYALMKWHPSDVSAEPYIKASVGPRLSLDDSRRHIGLVWMGSSTHARDHERSIDLQRLEPLWGIPSVSFYAPFIGSNLEMACQQVPIQLLGNQIRDFADTAAILKQLDCVITVDTAVAHLAGALGVETHLLLPYCPDWRWGVSGEKTYWYHSIKVYRQASYGDWGPTISQLVNVVGQH